MRLTKIYVVLSCILERTNRRQAIETMTFEVLLKYRGQPKLSSLQDACCTSVTLKCLCLILTDNVFGKGDPDEDSVRASGKIAVSFTPRVFPTAMRESTKHLEDEVINGRVLMAYWEVCC